VISKCTTGCPMVSPFRAVVSRPRRREGFCGLALSLVSSRGVSLRDTPCFSSSGQSFRESRTFVYRRLEPSVHGPQRNSIRCEFRPPSRAGLPCGLLKLSLLSPIIFPEVSSIELHAWRRAERRRGLALPAKPCPNIRNARRRHFLPRRRCCHA
jgi:hypothetical protein